MAKKTERERGDNRAPALYSLDYEALQAPIGPGKRPATHCLRSSIRRGRVTGGVFTLRRPAQWVRPGRAAAGICIAMTTGPPAFCFLIPTAHQESI